MQLNLKQKQLVLGVTLFVVGTGGLSYQALKTQTTPIEKGHSLPDDVYTGLNTIERNLERLSRGLNSVINEGKTNKTETVELVSYRATQTQLLEFINWLKGKQLLFRNDVARAFPGFPLESRLQDEETLSRWKTMFSTAVTYTTKQVDFLNVSSELKSEMKMKLANMGKSAEAITWGTNKKPTTKSFKALSQASLTQIEQMQKGIQNIDQALISWGMAQSEKQTNTPSKTFAWMMLATLLAGLATALQALFVLMKNKGQVSAVAQNTATKAVMANNNAVNVNEKEVLNHMNDAVFYLGSQYQVLWTNKAGANMDITKEQLSNVVKNAYKEEDGKRISSFQGQDYILQVEYLKELMEDGSKIFCLILSPTTESNNAPVLEQNEWNRLMTQSVHAENENNFKVNNYLKDQLQKMNYIFNLSGSVFKLEEKEFECKAEKEKVEKGLKLYLSALHALIKDDFESKTVIISPEIVGHRIQMGAFIPSLVVEGKVSQMKKLTFQAFLEEMVKIEKTLNAYKARVIIRQKVGDGLEVGGLVINLSFENKNALEEILNRAQVEV